MADNSILEKIIGHKKIALEKIKKELPLKKIKEGLDQAPPIRNFSSALRISSSNKGINTPPVPNIIAEIKKASPSKGIIRQEFNPVEIAKIYEDNSACAISVLTEEKFFLGSLEYLISIKRITKRLPILRKDFIFDHYQLYESRYYGADAVLLIAAVLSDNQINEFLDEAKLLGLDCLVEIHNQQELEKVLNTEAKIIGINNRDLKTFKVDIKTTLTLLSELPKDYISVSESGIKSYEDMLLLGKTGVNAVLVGETLMSSKDIGKALKNLFSPHL